MSTWERESSACRRICHAPTADGFNRQAVDLLTSGEVRKAFDLTQETAAVRDRYGRHHWGQSALLARRLAEAGCGLIHVNLLSIYKTGNYNGYADNWDDHSEAARGNIFDSMRRRLPVLDQTVTALIEDIYRAKRPRQENQCSLSAESSAERRASTTNRAGQAAITGARQGVGAGLRRRREPRAGHRRHRRPRGRTQNAQTRSQRPAGHPLPLPGDRLHANHSQWQGPAVTDPALRSADRGTGVKAISSPPALLAAVH